ncbi:hypothetical protein L2E82_30105 [Cichorium intybus]|uniref:Uncharacterized protein n=1 Tax=Cichorium intybus TaxID=13427 RepID=A0ACB9CZG2_CICIN|nr:hypothetical protein L2E82_30105 [Cichorium intybus]
MCHTVSFRIPSSIVIASPGINYLTLSIVSFNQMIALNPTVFLDHEFFLKELLSYSCSGIANEMTMLIMFRLVMRFG